jgi:hypothetical protein
MSNDSLTKVSNIVFIFTCAILVVLAVNRSVADRRVSPNTPPAARTSIVSKGMKLSNIDGLSFSDARLTVALVVNSECRFCADSIPFYRRIAELRRPGNVQLVALSLEPVDSLTKYLEQNAVTVDRALQLQGPTVIPTTGTPTLVLVGQDGTVSSRWLGRLDANQEQEVIRAISAS